MTEENTGEMQVINPPHAFRLALRYQKQVQGVDAINYLWDIARVVEVVCLEAIYFGQTASFSKVEEMIDVVDVGIGQFRSSVDARNRSSTIKYARQLGESDTVP